MDVPTLNKLFLTELSGGDKTFELELLSIFRNDTKLRIAKIDGAIKTQNIEIIKIELHSLKGASANVGADKVNRATEQIETLLAEKDFDLLATQLNVLKQYCEDTFQAIDAYK